MDLHSSPILAAFIFIKWSNDIRFTIIICVAHSNITIAIIAGMKAGFNINISVCVYGKVPCKAWKTVYHGKGFKAIRQNKSGIVWIPWRKLRALIMCKTVSLQRKL